MPNQIFHQNQTEANTIKAPFFIFQDLLDKMEKGEFTTHFISCQQVWDLGRAEVNSLVRQHYKNQPELLDYDPYLLRYLHTEAYRAIHHTHLFYLAEKISQGEKLVPFKLDCSSEEIDQEFIAKFKELRQKLEDDLTPDRQRGLSEIHKMRIESFKTKLDKPYGFKFLEQVASDLLLDAVIWGYVLSLVIEDHKVAINA